MGHLIIEEKSFLRPVSNVEGKQPVGRGGQPTCPSLPVSFLVLALEVSHLGNPHSPGKLGIIGGGAMITLPPPPTKGHNKEEGGKMDGEGWPWQRLGRGAEKYVGGLCCPREGGGHLRV